MRAAGVWGYLRKDRIHEELAQALRAVAAGSSWWGSGAESPGWKRHREGASALLNLA